MRLQTLKLSSQRFEVSDNTSWGIQNWGKNNLYPLELDNVARSGSTTDGCLKRYVKFILGDGFEDRAFAEMRANNNDTFDDILEKCADDLGRFGGYAISVNYDVNGKITEIFHVPFENCRLALADEKGEVSKIGVFPDWTGQKKFGGKALKPSKDKIVWIDRFNPGKFYGQLPENGLEDYNGQIIWFSTTGLNSYPLAKHDAGITEVSTDEGLANIAYRTVRSGFYSAGAFISKKGMNSGGDENRDDSDSIESKIAQLQGDQNLNKMLFLELDFDEEKPEFIEFGGKNYDKEFDVTNKNTVERIYSLFEQEGFYRIRTGDLGFGSEIIEQVYEYYSSVTGTERRQLERGFDKVVKNWHEPMDTIVTKIQPLKYITNVQQANNNRRYT